MARCPAKASCSKRIDAAEGDQLGRFVIASDKRSNPVEQSVFLDCFGGKPPCSDEERTRPDLSNARSRSLRSMILTENPSHFPRIML
jgi:hypothetical protein